MSIHQSTRSHCQGRLFLALLAVASSSFGQTATPKTLLIFNPWNGQFGNVPKASFDGGATWVQTQSVPRYCGWYQATTTEASKTVVVSDTAGSTSSAIALSWTSDTLFLSDALGTPATSPYFNGITGICLVSQLAATIRDFDSTTNRDFEPNPLNVGLTTGMVLPTLGADNTPTASTTTTAKHFPQWFHDTPGVNATTCVDIPLALDADGTYSYQDSTYFPIDTFQNPHNNLVFAPADAFYTAREDGKLHNFNFCLESHATFVYKPGQTFRFSGDDDVWVYFNKQLAIDLGGIHGELSSTINLDAVAPALGLVAGQTYPWDFFFCERHVNQSHLRIVTNLNLQTSAAFTVKRSEDSSTGKVAFTILGSLPGQGCEASARTFRSSGKFVLSGGGLATPIILPSGVSFGGLAVDPSQGSLLVDTTSISGLQPGTYIVHAFAASDSTVSQVISFIVPPLPVPVFAGAKPSYVGPLGTGLWVPVTEIRPDTKASSGQSIPFVVHPVAGLSFCKDSLCTQPLAAGDTLMTGTGGITRSLWVRGDAPGTYTLVVGKAAGDSSDVRTGIQFLSVPVPVFAGTKPSYSGIVGSGLWVPVSERRPDTKVGSGQSIPFVVHPVPGLSFCLDSLCSRPLAAGDTLMTGSGGVTRNLWVRGNVSGTYSLVVGNTGGDSTDVRTNIQFLDARLLFVDSSWLPFATTPPISEPVRATVQIRIAVFDAKGICAACTDSVVLSSAFPGLKFLAGPSGPELDTLILSAGRGTFWISSASPVDAASLLAAPTSGKDASAAWSPVSFTASPPDSGWFLDLNGDGRVDGAKIDLHQPWSPRNTLRLAWPGIADSLVVETSEITASPDSMSLSIHLGPGREFGQNLTSMSNSSDSLGQWAWDGTWPLRKFRMRDGVAPVIVGATVRFAALDGAPDTLKVVFSEPIAFDASQAASFAPWVSWGRPSVDSSGSFVPYGGYLANGSSSVDLLVRLNDSFKIALGDSVRITASPEGIVSDTAGNRPGRVALWTPVTFGPTPLKLTIKPYIPIRTYTGWPIPANAPNVQLLVHEGPGTPWHMPDGSPSTVDTSKVSGIVLRTNRAIVGGFYLYDNLGVSLTSASLGPVNIALENKTLATDSRGNYEVFFTWNGRSDNGVIAPSGVYLVRIFGWKQEGKQKVLVNEVHRIGWRSTLPGN